LPQKRIRGLGHVMVELSAEWALVFATAGLVGATAILAYFTWRLARESGALTGMTAALVEQTKRQVEVAKAGIKIDAELRGRSTYGVDEI